VWSRLPPTGPLFGLWQRRSPFVCFGNQSSFLPSFVYIPSPLLPLHGEIYLCTAPTFFQITSRRQCDNQRPPKCLPSLAEGPSVWKLSQLVPLHTSLVFFENNTSAQLTPNLVLNSFLLRSVEIKYAAPTCSFYLSERSESVPPQRTPVLDSNLENDIALLIHFV